MLTRKAADRLQTTNGTGRPTAGLVGLLLAVLWIVGGFSIYNSPALILIFLSLALVLIAGSGVLIFRHRKIPLSLGPGALITAAALLSSLVNRDLPMASYLLIVAYVYGLAVMVLTARLVQAVVLEVLTWACKSWLILWPVAHILGWEDNRNLEAIWPSLAVIVILARQQPIWHTIPFILALIILGSRGAIIGLGSALLVFYHPTWPTWRWVFLSVLALTVLAALFAWRPQNAINRLSYWCQGIHALAAHNPLFGLGPTGISARRAILEPGRSPDEPGAWQPHAHNWIIQILVEYGLIGLLSMVLAVVWIWRSHPANGWPAAILTGFLVHGLVDYSLSFVGPLTVFCGVAGLIGDRPAADPYQLAGEFVTKGGE